MASDSDESGSEGLAHGKSRAIHPGNSALITAGIISADVIGAGILAMANAIATFGWLLGTFLLLVMLAMNIHISLLMWRNKMQHPEALDYKGLVAAVFRNAPRLQRKFMMGLTACSQFAFIFGMLALYILSFGKSLGMIFYDTRICLPVWALIGCALILPFSMSARAMGTWQSLIYANTVTLLGSIFIPLATMALQGVEQTRPSSASFDAVAQHIDAHGVLSGLSTYAFAATSQFMLVEIMSEMRDVSELPHAYTGIFAPFQVFSFLLVGVGGYYYKGSSVHGMIIDNIAFGWGFRVAAVCLLVHMLVVYQIKCMVLGRILHKCLHSSTADAEGSVAWTVWSAIILGVCACAYTFSQVVPFFSDFVDLLGAFLAPISCLLIPVLMYLRSLWPPEGDAEDSMEDGDGSGSEQSTVAGRSRVNVLEVLVMILEVAVALGLTLIGTWSALQNIVKNWNTYGYPFACHCEDIWNTCACSLGHTGMEHCEVQSPRAEL